MRMGVLFGALLGMGIAAAAMAADAGTVMMDDFSSAQAMKAWTARPNAKLTHVPAGMQLEMPKYGGDQGEAMWPGMERTLRDLPLSQYNGILVDVTNTSGHRQPLGIGFHDPKGSASTFTELQGGERRVVRIPFDQMISGTADWSNIQRITVTWTTPPFPMTWVFHKIEFYTDDPAATELGQLRSLLKQTRQAFDEAKKAGVLSPRQLQETLKTVAQWDQAVAGSEGIRGKDADCRNELGALQSRLRLATLGKTLKGAAALWSVPVGTRFEPDSAMLQYHEPLTKLHLTGAKGQYVDGIVRLTNLTDAGQDWQVKPDSKESAVAQAISVRRNQAVVAADRSVVGDALVPLDRAGVVSVGPHETVELWVRADLKHHAWKPGTHEAELEFKDLRRGIASIVKLPLEVTAWNFDLTKAPGLHLGLWASLYWGNAAMLAGREEAALDNLVDYGCDVLTINPGQMPWPKLSAEGVPQSEMDFTGFDKLIKLYRSKGDPIILIWLGLDDNHPDMQQLYSHLPLYSPAWEKGMHWWLGQLIQRMKTLGVPMDRYAFYVTDEPNEAELDLTKVVAQTAKSIDPAVQIYMDSSELYEDPKKNDELMKLVDINQPNGDGMTARPYLLAELKKYKNCTLWMYQCRTNTRARQLVNAYDYYRLQAWQAVSEGMKGIGFWVYAYNAQKDFWDGTTSNGGGAGMVYADSDKGLLASVRYELIRMGLDDMRYYQLLEKAPRTAATEALLGERFKQVRTHPHNPAMAVQWREDAGKAIAGQK